MFLLPPLTFISFPLLHLYVRECVCTGGVLVTYVFAGGMQRPKEDVGGLLCHPLPYIPFRQFLSLNLGLDQQLAPANILFPSPKSAEITERHSHAQICFKNVDVGYLVF